jgi:hypothetical protein
VQALLMMNEPILRGGRHFAQQLGPAEQATRTSPSL